MSEDAHLRVIHNLYICVCVLLSRTRYYAGVVHRRIYPLNVVINIIVYIKLAVISCKVCFNTLYNTHSRQEMRYNAHIAEMPYMRRILHIYAVVGHAEIAKSRLCG